MKFYVVAYRYAEDVFYDFEEQECVEHALTSSCLLPAYWMAEEYIEDHLGDDYVVDEIEILSVEGEGIFSYKVSSSGGY
jgi:hypothetical protein